MLDSSTRPQLALIHNLEPEDEPAPVHVQSESSALRSAQYGDIPGTRYHPDDGQWPRTYQMLSEPELSRMLDDYAEPAVAEFEDGLRADALNFQPFRRKASQDRYVVEQWDIDGKIWTMTGVFDGHLGDAVVEHSACHLPVIIRTGIEKAYTIYGAGNLSVRTVSQILHDGIVSFDQAIVNDVLALFPGGIHTLMSLSDEQIRGIINDPYGDFENYRKVQLCLHGTTALVALVDPSRENLWIANLGDCQAVLYRQDAITKGWSGEVLTNPLSGKNPFEVAKVQREHPGEPDCVLDGRILGVIEPFRSIGDHPFKQPAIFTRRVLFNLEPGISGVHQWEKMLNRNLSPPYVSSTPEVTHKRLRNPLRSRLSPDSDATKPMDELVLLISTDGLSDLSEGRPANYDPFRAYLDAMLDSNNELKKSLDDNLALCVLKSALGQDDEALSKALTLEMDSQWIDDVTIVVQML